MRFLVVSRLLCILLLCFSIFFVEGRKNSSHLSKPRKRRLCCSRVPSPALTTQKGRHVKICRLCKFKPESRIWVVPGALPQV
ncbi:protein GPR15L isoform X2 [Zalophus californianus]|uniref:Protein GPR15L isoform X2 n=1 Tax=Zalophus californianus TaxID=9704 RepID=A0A6J2D840_ZALCA|nr:protein GPR15L isoform X2 [Zalophus californianus]XP_027954403.1 protein GPR15L [Eumetopias jubatus]